MKHKALRVFAIFLAAITVTACFSVPVSAANKKFSPIVDTQNIGVRTQYVYDENDPSWLRKLVVKEDLLSVEGIANECVLQPVTSYPYRTDAPCFKEEVAGYVTTFTLDESSRKAAYIYILNQIGALDLITSAPPEGQSKADWLRERGIVITKDDETNPDSVVMINALYSLMKNDFYYVITGNHITIPEGTKLEAAVMMYLIAISDKDSKLADFLQKYFSNTNILTLEDYIYYTSLMTLFTNGYVTVRELPKMTHEEVYRRLAIMTIRNAGISIDSENASTEEIQIKYLAAMLGIQYEVKVDPQSLETEVKRDTVAYYLLRRMAYEDASITISTTRYSYEQAFELTKTKTHRFDLENKFYSDISEYNVYLNNRRSSVYVKPTPISIAGLEIYINDTKVAENKYSKVDLTGSKLQIIYITTKHTSKGTTKTSYYRIKVHQGSVPASDSNITGVIESIGDVTIFDPSKDYIDALRPAVTKINDIAPSIYDLIGKAVSVNEKGQLVDKDGNVISDSQYTLPDGYKYSIDDAGRITIIRIDDDTTAGDAANTGAAQKNPTVRILIVVGSALLLIALIAVIVIVMKTTAKKKNKSQYYAARKVKEKAKKAKKQARLDKRNAKKK